MITDKMSEQPTKRSIAAQVGSAQASIEQPSDPVDPAILERVRSHLQHILQNLLETQAQGDTERGDTGLHEAGYNVQIGNQALRIFFRIPTSNIPRTSRELDELMDETASAQEPPTASLELGVTPTTAFEAVVDTSVIELSPTTALQSVSEAATDQTSWDDIIAGQSRPSGPRHMR